MTKKGKKTTTSSLAEKAENDLADQLKIATEDLWYLSETDAEIFPFVGKAADSVTKENLLEQIDRSADTAVEERDFTELFARLARIQDWYGEEEKKTAHRFAVLRDLLKDNLRDLKVFKLGQIEIDIYVVGIDKKGNLMGIRTKAVET